MFGVKRQAVEQWEHKGDVPAARREKLANLLSVGEMLERKLIAGRLPLVARRRADVYGGLTMLDMVRADRDSELRELTERAFDLTFRRSASPFKSNLRASSRLARRSQG